jgi:hypothetical protein
MSDAEKLLRYYRDEDKPFPLPRLDGMYVRPRYAIHQHELDELLDAVANLIRKRDEALALAEARAAAAKVFAIEAKEARAKALEEAAGKVPTNWLDALLTGPEGIGSSPYDGRHIEKLLLNIRTAILALKDKPTVQE